MRPLKHNSIHIASQAPLKPITGAREAANVNRTPHIERKFIPHGTNVSPAPTKTPYATILAANIGSAHASIRNAITPRSRISSTGDRIDIINGAQKYMTTPISDIINIPNPTDINAKRRVKSLLFAPIL